MIRSILPGLLRVPRTGRTASAAAPLRRHVGSCVAALRRGLDALRPGPLYGYDLLRLARRSRSTLLRTSYALLLLLTLYVLQITLFPQHALLLEEKAHFTHARQQAHFAQVFTVGVLVLQVAAVLILTPVYLASAIAEEKERRTLELLLTTRLSDREIVLGKSLSRITHLAAVLVTGLPILVLLQFLGDPQPGLLLCGLSLTLFTLLSVGGVSILCSVLSRNVLRATFHSYLVVTLWLCGALLFCGMSPLGYLAWLDEMSGTNVLEVLWPMSNYTRGPSVLAVRPALLMATAYALGHGMIALTCVWLATISLRASAGVAEPTAAPQPVGALLPVGAAGWDPLPPDPELPPRPARLTPTRPPIGDQPLLWRELYHDTAAGSPWTFRAVYGAGTLLPLAVIAVLGGCVVLTWTLAQDGTPLGDSLAVLTRVVQEATRLTAIALTSVWWLAVGLRAAGSVSQEYEQRTLLNLLLLPQDRTALLEAKWLGSVLRYRQLAYLVAAAWTIGLLSGALHPGAVALLAVACLAHVLFVASLGTWLSVATRRTLLARAVTMLVLLTLVFGGVVWQLYARLLEQRYRVGESWRPFVEFGLSPLRAWSYLSLSWEEFAREVLDGDAAYAGRYLHTMLGLLTFVALAWLLWHAARLRFRSEDFGA
jgi:ABC-type transport system involved in multi-copper enzyme maturation permease subunit